MSRLQNKVLRGYFPTPPSLIDAIAVSLRPPAGRHFRWLDPCAGEGVALSMLAERLGGETFGIELDVERAVAAAQRIEHALQGDFADMRLPLNPPGVSALFLNPPYDDDDGAGRRLELHFLRESEDWLMPGGVLIFMIPQYRLSDHIARRLSSGYERLRVYCFPDAEYARFRQVIVYGVKRGGRREDTASLLALLQAQSAALPALPSTPDVPYAIPPASGAPWFFRPFDIPPTLIVEEARRAGVFTGRAWSDLVDPRSLVHNRPLMPLRRGHVGTMAEAVREQVATSDRAARARTRIVVDEFQALPTVDYADFLATLAKYGANFILATQSLGIVKELDPRMYHALLANVSTLCAIQTNYSDAEILSSEMGGVVTPEDIVGLPDHACFLSLVSGGVQQPPVYVQTLPPLLERESEERAQQIIGRSRDRYGHPIDSVLQQQALAWTTKVRVPPRSDQSTPEATGQQTQATSASNQGSAATPDIQMQSNRLPDDIVT